MKQFLILTLLLLFACQKEFNTQEKRNIAAAGGGKRDTTPPTVSITSPTGTIDPTPTTITTTASDNKGVASVEMKVNAVSIGTDVTSPYNFSWDATPYAGTTVTLKATATDLSGNTAIHSVSVTVNPIPPPPPPPSYTEMVTPTPYAQGNEGSCSAFAVVYAGMSIEQYYRTGTMTIFSPEYVYDQVKAIGDCWAGSSVTGCLDFIYNLGVCTWATCPYSDTNGCSITPTSEQIAEAAQHKIPNYGRLTNTDRTGIKNSVITHHPVMTGINIDANFTNAQAGYIWNSIGSGNAPHAVAVIGYDDSKNAYLIMNSFGTSWGDGGFLWVDYNIYEQRAGFYSYVMNY